MKIIIISYSSRKNGNCYRIAEYIKGLFSKNTLFQTEIISFSNIKSSGCGTCNYECFDDTCVFNNDALSQLYRSLLNADLLISIIPIYCGVPCSNYFIMNERAQGALSDDEYEVWDAMKKKYIVIGNTGLDITKSIIKENDPSFSEDSFVSISSNIVHERSIKGNLIDYSIFKRIIKQFLSALLC
ncbi:MAG: flavodoxin family protein [Lachnospiraceae bacterium]|nr:flavodoxin family protein [Lachnospiraceae bacterium]